MMYEISPGNVGCMSCGSSNCGLFTCWDGPPSDYERKLELRREAANRIGRHEPRYQVFYSDSEGPLSGSERFFTWRRARYAAVHTNDESGEIRGTVWDRELRLDVTAHPNPSSLWPRWGHGPLALDDLPF